MIEALTERAPLAEILCDLCEKHDNEDLHTEYVTDLALELFDLSHDILGVPPDSRILLETAGLLHDVGYAARPDGHAEESAKIALSADLPGITESQCRTIAAIIFLHSKRNSRALNHEMVVAAADKTLALQLGAYLRIADALDHSHLQDAVIESIDIEESVITISFAGSWYRGVLSRLKEKADLWKEIFHADIKFSETIPAGEGFEGLLHSDDSALEACRRLLVSQYRIAKGNVAEALAGQDPEPLHDIRVALRRFRSVISLFRPLLLKTGAHEVNRLVRDMNRQLGSARDTDVWIQFLNESGLIDDQEAWKVYMKSQQTKARKSDEELQSILGGSDFEEMMNRMAFLVRIEIPRLIRSQKDKSFAKFAARRLRKMFKRIAGTKCDMKELPPEQLHQIRQMCRRERYWAEFTAPLLGKGMQRLARHLKLVTTSLGDVHDMDIHLGALESDEAPAPSSLQPYLLAFRERALGEFAAVWKKLHGKRYLKKIQRSLRKGVHA